MSDPVGHWLRFEPDGTVTVLTGKVEIGQGIHTALAQIVADELDLPLDRVRVARVDTVRSPDEGVTSGSRSIEEAGTALRHAAAEARRALGAGLDPSRVHDLPVTGDAPTKRADELRVVGTSAPRGDVRAKVTGGRAYLQDLALPGQLHGRVLRPPGYGATLRSLDEAEVRAMPGVVALVRDGSFVGVVAEREEQAIRALARLRRLAVWDERATLPATADPRYLLALPTDDIVVAERTDEAARGRIARMHRAEYSRPAIAHGAIGPSCAVASAEGGRFTVWTHAQGVYQLRHELAKVLGVPRDDVCVTHVEGSGCYGHNGADDVALDAALLARAVPGRPVRVQWMRDDEFAWEPYGTPMVVRITAGLDDRGDIVSWAHELWGHGHGNRPSTTTPDDVASVLAAQHLGRPYRPSAAPRPRSPDSGGNRNAAPLYEFPDLRVVNHYVAAAPLRVSALRSLGAHANVFAIESSMDELAADAGADPIEFRLRYLRDPRAREVVETVAAKAAWRPREAGDGTRGRGIGFARYKNGAAYLAVIAEVELAREVRVRHIWAAIDAGLAVNPRGVIDQTEGGLTQAAGWTLKEAVRYDERRILTRSWADYPMITFSETPRVDVTVIQRKDEPSLGIGEAFAGPIAAALGNAIHNAAGVRLRDMPFTRERLVAAVGS